MPVRTESILIPALYVALVCLVLLAFGLSPSPAQETPAPHLIPFDIQDQHGARHTHLRFAGKPLLAAWGDRRGSDFMRSWNRALADSLDGDIARLDVAHVKGAPFFIKGRIRKRFREDWTDPVLLDWKGRFQAAYGCASDSCTLLLFGRDGALQGRWVAGEPDPGQLASVTKAAQEAASALP